MATTDTAELSYHSVKDNSIAYLHLDNTFIQPYMTVTLYDKVTNTSTDFVANPNYMFTHSNNDPENRFLIITGNNTIGLDDYAATEDLVDVYIAGNELIVEGKNYSGPTIVTLFDMSGKVMMKRKIDVVEGVKNRVAINGLAKSLYTAEINTKSGKSMVQKLVN